MKVALFLLGIGFYTISFSYGTTYTRDIAPITVGFENNDEGQIVKIFTRNIGNRLWKTSKMVSIKLNEKEYKSQLRRFPEGDLPLKNKTGMGYAAIGYYTLKVKDQKLSHCQINKVHIEVSNSFQNSTRGVKDNDKRELASFEFGNDEECLNLPMAFRRPLGIGIFNKGEL